MLSCRQGTCITSDNPVSTSNELQSPVNYPESYDGLGKRVRKLSNKYDGFDEPIAVYSLLLSLFFFIVVLYVDMSAMLIFWRVINVM